MFFTSSLAGGGAERVLIRVLHNLDRNSFSPYLTLMKREGDFLNDIPSDVRTYDIGMSGSRLGKEMPKLIWRLGRIMNAVKPDVVLSFMWEANILNVISNFFFRRGTVILSERVAPTPNLISLFGSGLLMKLIKGVIKVLYSHVDYIIAVSEGVKKELALLSLPKDKIGVIYNPVDIPLIDRMSLEELHVERPYILFVGRLESQKNIPLLIQAYNAMKDKFDVDLMILGKGGEYENLKCLCQSLRLENRVIFKGFESNPYKYMRNAKAFVLPSDYEGFPNVLLEAMVCGVPIISTSCPYGPEEVIAHGKDGLMVPVGDIGSLASAIGCVLGDGTLRERIVAGGFEKCRKFSVREVVKQYEQVIYNTCRK